MLRGEGRSAQGEPEEEVRRRGAGAGAGAGAVRGAGGRTTSWLRITSRSETGADFAATDVLEAGLGALSRKEALLGVQKWPRTAHVI